MNWSNDKRVKYAAPNAEGPGPVTVARGKWTLATELLDSLLQDLTERERGRAGDPINHNRNL